MLSLETKVSFLLYGAAIATTMGALIGLLGLKYNNDLSKQEKINFILLESKTEKYRKETAEVELKLALANERAIKAESDLFELKHKIAPRDITKEQEHIISEKLSKFKGQSIVLRCIGNNAESRQFSDKLYRALKKAGLVIDQNRAVGGTSMVGSGSVAESFWRDNYGIVVIAGNDRVFLLEGIREAFASSKIIKQGIGFAMSPQKECFVIEIWPK